MRITIVYALGGEPKPSHSDEALDQLIAMNNPTILNLLHDLIAMLDYLDDLIRSNVTLQQEEDEIFEVAGKLVLEVKEPLVFIAKTRPFHQIKTSEDV